MLYGAEGGFVWFGFLIFSAEQLGICEAAPGLLGRGSCVLANALRVGGSVDCPSALVSHHTVSSTPVVASCHKSRLL